MKASDLRTETHVTVHLTPAHERRLARCSAEFLQSSARAFQLTWLLNIALLNFDRLAPCIEAEREYVIAEDIQDLTGYQQRKLQQITRRK